MKPVQKIIVKSTILALLIAYVVVAGIWVHSEASKRVCTGIEIVVDGPEAMKEVVHRGVEEELSKYRRPITGMQYNRINTGEIERFLARGKNFESVNCMISSRGKLVVRVVPLIPVMRVFFGEDSYYINKDGNHIRSNAEFFSDVPVVNGKFCRQFTPKDVLPLVNYIKKDRLLSDLVSMIVAENKNNLILVPRFKGHVINFGDTTRLEEKSHALALFYREVMPYKGWEEYDTISVKYRGQVVATRRDKSRLNHAEEYLEEVDLEEGTLPEESGMGTPQVTENITNN